MRKVFNEKIILGSVQVIHQHVGGAVGLRENAVPADTFKGESQVKIDDIKYLLNGS